LPLRRCEVWIARLRDGRGEDVLTARIDTYALRPAQLLVQDGGLAAGELIDGVDAEQR
jgi:hypothetical protein